MTSIANLYMFLFHLQFCSLPEDKEIINYLVLLDEYPATSYLCKDHNLLKSTNFVVLFESENLVGNLVKALRLKG